MLKVGIITSTERPGRIALDVAKNILKIAENHGQAKYQLLDIKDFNLPKFNNQHRDDQASEEDLAVIKPWLDALETIDAFIFITAEYNRSIPSNLKNALDYVDVQWKDKVGGIISYGEYGGTRAAEHLRGMMATYPMVMDSAHPVLSIEEDVCDHQVTLPDKQIKRIHKLIDQLLRWSNAINYYKKDVLNKL